VHTNSLKAAVYGGIAARLARVPVVWHIRDRIAPDYLPRQAVAAVKVLAMFVPRAIVFNSRATRDALRVPVSFSVIPSPVVYDGVATPVLPHSDGPPHPLRFTMLGRLAPWKGQHVFLRAFAAAFPAGRERAIVAGSAMFGEDDYAEELRRLAVRLGIAERVEFTGFVTDITALLDRSDVVVHASVVPEPFGQVVVEGMAAGLPVIATAAGGPLEIITGDVDGLLVPPDDASALARAMSRLAADPHLRHALGVAGQVRASDFTPARVAEITTELWAAVAHDAR